MQKFSVFATTIFANAALALTLCAAFANVHLHAQSAMQPTHKLPLQAQVKPGETLRYELEAAGSFVPVADASGAILTPPRGLCEYSLAAIVTLRPLAPDNDANIPVEA